VVFYHQNAFALGTDPARPTRSQSGLEQTDDRLLGNIDRHRRMHEA
jgi:hypothetical protein